MTGFGHGEHTFCVAGSGVQPRRFTGGEGHNHQRGPETEHAHLTRCSSQMQDNRIKLICSLGVAGDMVGQEAGSGLWSGVSGVPGPFRPFEVLYLERDLVSRPWSLHSSTPSVSFGRVGQVKLSPNPIFSPNTLLCRHDHGDSRGSHRRRSEVVGGRGVELPRVLSPRRWARCESQCDQPALPALPADRPGGRRAARAAAAQSPQGEVVAEVPSTPHRYFTLMSSTRVL